MHTFGGTGHVLSMIVFHGSPTHPVLLHASRWIFVASFGMVTAWRQPADALLTSTTLLETPFSV